MEENNENVEEVEQNIEEQNSEIIEEKSENNDLVSSNVEETTTEETTTEETTTVEENTEIKQDIEEPKEDTIEKEVKIEQPNNPKKSNKGIIVFLVLLICLGVAGVLLLSGKDEENSNDKDKEDNTIPNKEYKSPYAMNGNSLEEFDLYFLKLENKEENKVYSPLSIKYALEMLSEGADGDTKKQIDGVIGSYAARKYNNNKNMSFANALFIKNTFSNNIKEEYKQILSSKYNADVILDSFESPKTINKWISDKTFNLINDLLTDVSDKDYILVNALAIDMEWEEKFLKAGYTGGYSHEKSSITNTALGIGHQIDVVSSKFENINKDISGMVIGASINNYDIISELGEENIRKTVGDDYRNYIKNNLESFRSEYNLAPDFKITDEYIEEKIKEYLDKYIEEISKNYHNNFRVTDFKLYTDDNVKVFAKDLKEYDGTTLQYVGIMPKNGDLKNYVENIKAEDINSILSSLKGINSEDFEEGKFIKIEGYIPKFKFDYELNLKSDLASLGIKDVFDSNKANLSKISDTKSYINEAKHKATIEFTQDGIKASAATAMGGYGAGGYYDYDFEVPTVLIDLTFDKPYMFLIRDKATGEVWFTGTVYNPLLWDEDLTSSSHYKYN